MRKYYSSRGARRGLLLAVLLLSGWCGWALGYMQNTTPRADVIIFEYLPVSAQQSSLPCCHGREGNPFL